MEFALSPALNDTYTFNGRTWRYDGVGWQRYINAGQVLQSFSLVSVTVDIDVTYLPALVSGAFSLVNYV